MTALRCLITAAFLAAGCSPQDRSRDLYRLAAPQPAAWTVSTWAIDPANVTGCASDDNACATTTCGAPGSGVGPCATWHAIHDTRWGCIGGGRGCPRLRQRTTITWVSGHTDGSDPVYFSPALETGVAAILVGQRTAVWSGVLSNVTPKNRPAGTLLSATLPAGAAAGQFLENTTRASHAWVWAAGALVSISQPFVEITPPLTNAGVFLGMPEVDTWTTGDTVAAYSFPSVDIVSVDPIVSDFDASRSTGVYLHNLRVEHFDGSAFGKNTRCGDDVYVTASIANRTLEFAAAGGFTYGGAYNTVALQGIAARSNVGGSVLILGGGTTWPISGCYGCIFDGDYIFDGSNLFTFLAANEGNVGVAYVGAGSTLHPRPGLLWLQSQAYGGPFLYGPGRVTVPSSGHVRYPSGASAATSALLVSGGLSINGSSTACAESSGTISCGRALTPANLDLAVDAGGFGGKAFLLGGGSVSNF